MNKLINGVLSLAVIGSLSGCASMSRNELKTYRDLERLGVERERVKSPLTAGVCQIAPGVGNFYLATGTDEDNQMIPGVVNIVPGWLIWPVGCLWAIPQGVIDANTINKKATVYYYTEDPEGIKEYQKLKSDRDS